MHDDMNRPRKVASKLEPKEMELQGALSASENMKNELDKLQNAYTSLVEVNEQLKNEKVGHEVAITSFQADSYKLDYVDHLQGRLSDYKFSRNDFGTYSIYLEDLLNFSFEVSFGRAAECQFA